MTPYNRVMFVVGGAAVIVSLAIGLVFVQAERADASLRTDAEAAIWLQSLGDELLAEAQVQRKAIDEYLLSAEPRPLARYRQAAIGEGLAVELGAEVGVWELEEVGVGLGEGDPPRLQAESTSAIRTIAGRVRIGYQNVGRTAKATRVP